MAQSSVAETQTRTSGQIPSFMSALQSGLNLNTAQNNMFSELLSEVNAMQPPPPPPDSQPAQPPVASDAANVQADSSSGSVNAEDSSAGDEAKLRGLLTRIRQDADNLKAARMRAGDAEDAAKKAAQNGNSAAAKTDKTAATTAQQPVATPTTKPTTKTDKHDEKTAKADDAKTSSDVNTDALLASAQAAVAVKPDDKTQVTGGASGDTAAILADKQQAEQAALQLMDRMMNDRGGASEAANDASGNKANVAAAAITGGVKNPVAGTSGKADLLKAGKNDALALPDSSGQLAGTGINVGADKVQSSKTADASAQATPQDTSTRGESRGGDSASNNDFLNLFNAAKAQNGSAPITNAAITGAGLAQNNDTAGGNAGNGDAASRAITGAQSAGATAQPPMQADGVRPAGSYDFASQLSAARAAKGGATGLPSAVEQVALQLHKQVSAGNDQMTINLRPAELGSINIKLEFSSDNKVQGTVTADNQSTLDLLSKDSSGLQRALQDAGMQVDANSLQFNLRGDGQQSQFSGNQNSGDNGSSSAAANANYKSDNADVGANVAADVSDTYYITPGRVNMRV